MLSWEVYSAMVVRKASKKMMRDKLGSAKLVKLGKFRDRNMLKATRNLMLRS
jgi:hypothetical protein